MTGEQLRKIRKAHDLSLPQFAEVVNYHPNHIAQCERGERDISPKLEKQILRAVEYLSVKKSLTPVDNPNG